MSSAMSEAAAAQPSPSVNITLPDGSVKTFTHPVTGAELATSIGPGLAKVAVAMDG